MSYIHINWTRFSETKRRVLDCPTCNRRRLMLCQFQEWYGWELTCLTCGERWQDGERLERPFMPRWRADSVKRAKDAWEACPKHWWWSMTPLSIEAK